MTRSDGVIQVINVYTELGNVLKLYVAEFGGGYKITGEYIDAINDQHTVVDFDENHCGDCADLLTKCLESFSGSLKRDNDRIVRLHNPCNTPYITGPHEQVILSQLNIIANVEVN